MNFQQVLMGVEDKTKVIVRENSWRNNSSPWVQTLLGHGSNLHLDL